MKTLCWTSTLAGLLALCEGMRAVGAAPKETTYPVMGILQIDPNLRATTLSLKGRETFEPIQQYKLIYTGDGDALRTVRDAKNQHGFNVPVIVYMGGFTTNPGGATAIEKSYRDAAAMINVTSLSQAIDAKTAEFRVAIPKDGEFPIKASTADITDPKDFSKYCFWIRVDYELMKVLDADGKTGALKVQRGFESQAAAHKDGAPVFTPVYLGNRTQLDATRHSNSWPGGPDYLRYAIDPASEAAQRFKADIIIDLMKTGYDGAWLDTFQPYVFNLCDALGRKVTAYWDFRQGRRYDPATFLSALQDMIRGVRSKVKAAVGREPYLAANSVSGSYEKGGKELFAAPGRPGLLDGYCFEDSYIGPQNSVRVSGRKLKTAFSPVSADRWMKNLVNQQDAARNGLRAYTMIGPAGYVAAYINPTQPNYEQLVRFAWCSFLLTVTKERTTFFGMPMLITKLDGRIGFLPLPDLFFYPIGDPVDNGAIESMKMKDANCHVRKFTNGLVIVSAPGPGRRAPVAGKPQTVAVPDGYADPKTKKPVKQVTLESGDAVLLLKGIK